MSQRSLGRDARGTPACAGCPADHRVDVAVAEVLRDLRIRPDRDRQHAERTGPCRTADRATGPSPRPVAAVTRDRSRSSNCLLAVVRARRATPARGFTSAVGARIQRASSTERRPRRPARRPRAGGSRAGAARSRRRS